jgi:hypothetical protein
MKTNNINKKVASLLEKCTNPSLFRNLLPLCNLDMVVNNTSPILFVLQNNKKLKFNFTSDQLFSFLQKCNLQNTETSISPIQFVLQNNKKFELFFNQKQLSFLIEKCNLEISKEIQKYNVNQHIIFLIISNNQSEKLNFDQKQIYEMLKKTNLESNITFFDEKTTLLSHFFYFLSEHNSLFTKEEIENLLIPLSENYIKDTIYDFLHHKKFFYKDTYCQEIISILFQKNHLENISELFFEHEHFLQFQDMEKSELFIQLQNLSLEHSLKNSNIQSKTMKI